MGDAAHASTPHQGAGAGMAVEDAYYLSNLLGMVDEAGGINAAFETFDEYRRPRSQTVVATSRQAGTLYDMTYEGVGDDAEKIKEKLNLRMKWIWEEEFENLDEAKEVLKGRLYSA